MMNGWNYLTILTLLLAAVLALVGTFAYLGDVWAGVVLGVIGAIVLVSIGWALAMAQATFHERAKHRAFQENANENIDLMAAQFKALSSMAGAQAKVADGIQRENIDLRRLINNNGHQEQGDSDFFQLDDQIMSRLLSDLNNPGATRGDR